MERSYTTTYTTRTDGAKTETTIACTLAAALAVVPVHAHACRRAVVLPPRTMQACIQVGAIEQDASGRPVFTVHLAPAAPPNLLAQVERDMGKLTGSSVRRQVAALVDRLRVSLQRFNVRGVAPFDLRQSDEDGSATLELRALDRRLAFTLETEEAESGWHVVSRLSSGGSQAYGDLSSDLVYPLTLMLS